MVVSVGFQGSGETNQERSEAQQLGFYKIKKKRYNLMKSSIWEAFKMRQKYKLERTKPCSFLGYY